MGRVRLERQLQDSDYGQPAEEPGEALERALEEVRDDRRDRQTAHLHFATQ